MLEHEGEGLETDGVVGPGTGPGGRRKQNFLSLSPCLGYVSALSLSLLIFKMMLKCESEVAQLCPTLCNPMECNWPGSSDHGNAGVGCHFLL